jgi:hypothetical protein
MRAAFTLATLATLCSVGASAETLTWTQPNCSLLSRKKFSKNWVASKGQLKKGLSVHVLAPSRLKDGAAYIFDVPGMPRAEGFEFKALASCFSAAEIEQENESVAKSSLQSSGDARWEAEFIFSKHRDYFEDAATKHLDAIATTAYAGHLRRVKRWGSSLELGYGGGLAWLSGKAADPVVNNVELNSVGVDAGGLLRWSFDLGAKASWALALPVQLRWSFWPKSEDGSMISPLSLRSSLLVHFVYRMGNINPYLDLGVTESLRGFDLRLGTEF